MSANSTELARRNRLLSGLPRAAYARLKPDLQLRQMHVRDCVSSHSRQIEEVFFPLSCVISMIAKGAEGEAVEVATLGNEGMAGLGVFLGVDRSATLETFVQVAGDAFAMRAKDFRAHLKDSARFVQIMGYYTQALLTQVSQASACNRMHPAEERFARWMLMTHDRVGRDEFGLTHEFAAQMLGVRRATVSEIAAALQAAHIIQYARGIVTVLDRAALEERSCECYRIIRDEYTRLLPFSTPSADLDDAMIK